MQTANQILARFPGRLATRRVVCEPGLTCRMPELLANFLPPGQWIMFADMNTWFAQGRSLAQAFKSSGPAFGVMKVDVVILRTPPGQKDLICNGQLVDQVLKSIQRFGGGQPTPDGSTPAAENLPAGPRAIVAVGSGTICDTVKIAAAATGLPSAAVATAPSMNGYPSAIAAVLRDGVKRTEPAQPPKVVLADLDVLRNAPPRMIAAGLADLLAKPVSTADWTLANAMLGDPISADGLAVVEESARLADGIAATLRGIPAPDSVARLFVSGLAMAVSGASSPASGGEHLISHYLDMTALAHADAGTPGHRDAGSRANADPSRLAATRRGALAHDLHGLQVGVATLVTARFYQRLLAWDPAGLDVQDRVNRQRPWADVQAELHAHFGSASVGLADAVLAEARKLYVEGDALARRLAKFCEIFPELRARLAPRLRAPESIEGDLLAAGAATRFDQIGVDPGRALSAIRFAHHVRARYTILHLLADLGVLDEWATEAIV